MTTPPEDSHPPLSNEEREERLRALQTLASGLCEDAGVSLATWEGEFWRWDPIRRVIAIPQVMLDAEYGLDYCAGVLSREVGHYFISRHHMFWLDFPSHSASRALMNALDASRVESWIAGRYPGTLPWLKLSVMPPARINPKLPKFMQFCLAAANEHRWEGQKPPEQLHPDVLWALDETREVRQMIHAVVPPSDMTVPDEPELDIYYRREVLPAMVRPRLLPSPWERFVQIHALEAHDLASDGVVPFVVDLLGDDLEALERWISDQEGRLEELLESLDAMSDTELMDLLQRALREAPPPRSRAVRMPLRLQMAARRLLNAVFEEANLRVDRLIQEPFELLPPIRWDRLPRLDPLNFRWEEPRDYTEAYDTVASQIEELARRLSQILRPRKRMRERAGYPSGRRVDLRKLMQFEADKRRYNELWSRSTIPDRRSVSVSLLVDLSGSMSGEKTNAALLGTVLLAETLHRLDIDFTINGFQDVLIPLFPFGADFDDGARDRIAEMPQEVDGCRTNGNNCPEYNDDGPCLLEAAGQLLDQPSSDRILIVISDGLPAGRRSTTADLRRAVRAVEDAEGLGLIGLGLGPDTEHVRDFYSESHANIATAKFTEKISELIEHIIV